MSAPRVVGPPPGCGPAPGLRSEDCAPPGALFGPPLTGFQSESLAPLMSPLGRSQESPGWSAVFGAQPGVFFIKEVTPGLATLAGKVREFLNGS